MSEVQQKRILSMGGAVCDRVQQTGTATTILPTLVCIKLRLHSTVLSYRTKVRLY